MKPTILILFYLLISLSSFTQTTDDTLFVNPHDATDGVGPIAAYRGFNNHFGELGITYAGFGHGVVGHSFSYLTNFKSKDEHLSGFSVEYYRGFAYFEVGINGTVFTNYKNLSSYIRPFIGLGFGGIYTLGYGYNVPIGHSYFKNEINRHEFRLIARLAYGPFDK